MKHKHADLIHAWADGAEIQWFDREVNQWKDIQSPNWASLQADYRIKPEEKKPVVRWLWAYSCAGQWTTTSNLYTEVEARQQGVTIKLEWSRTEFPE